MKPWTYTNKCTECDTEITFENTIKYKAVSPAVAFMGQKNRFGMIPNFVKDGECACGKKYSIGFFRKGGKYVVGLLIDRVYLESLQPVKSKKQEDDNEISPAHSSKPIALMEYTREEIDMPIPAEIDMMSKRNLVIIACNLKIPTAKLAADIEIIKKMVTIERERQKIKKQKEQVIYMARKERMKQQKEAAVRGETVSDDAEDDEDDEDVNGDSDNIQLIEDSDVTAESPTVV